MGHAMNQVDACNIRKNILKLALGAGNHGAHIAPSLSMADIMAVLFGGIIQKEKDKFVLSKGHGGLCYYAALFEGGWITKEELDSYGKDGSKFPGQPIKNERNGICFSSGSLGLGLSYAVGLALSQKRAGGGISYVLLGDGELNEGSIWEAVMFAKQHELDNITAIVDWNGMQSDGFTKDIINLSLEKVWKSYGWKTLVCDGHNRRELEEAFRASPEGRPKVILAKTVKGKGVSYMENNKAWHHSRLTTEQYESAVQELEGRDGI